MSREVMQMALDMLNESADDVYCDQKLEGVITALRQALETKREWVGLTDEEINSVRDSRDWTAPWTDATFARYIEAKLREKNT